MKVNIQGALAGGLEYFTVFVSHYDHFNIIQAQFLYHFLLKSIQNGAKNSKLCTSNYG